MSPRVVCPACGEVQFNVPIRMIREATSPNHLMELLTAAKPRHHRRTFRWGVCKTSGCQGRWWVPRAFKGWIYIQVPTALKTKLTHTLADKVTAGDFEVEERDE